MLKKEKELNYKSVRGKRIRTRHFTYMLICYSLLIFPFPISAIFSGASWETLKIMFLILLPVLLLFVFIMLLDRFILSELLCVLSDSKLYFFKQTLIEANLSTGRKKESVCNGSIDYDDIKKMEYVPAVEKRKSIRRIVTLFPKYVILQGVDFQLKILHADKSLIKKIKKRQTKPFDQASQQCIPNFESMKHERSGLWKKIWDTLEDHECENIFDKHARVSYFDANESSNSITINVINDNCEFTFNIDEEGIFMYAENNNKEKSLLLSEIFNIDDLYKQMNLFITENKC